MLTENFLVKEITFPKGEFIKACNQVSSDFGIKGQDWFNITCMRKGDKEVMRFRHKAPLIVNKWEAFDIIVEKNDLIWDEFIQLEGFKSEYLLKDVETFLKINGK